MIIAIAVPREERRVVLEYLTNVKNRERALPFPLWNLKTFLYDLREGKTLVFFHIDIKIPVGIICTIGGFLSLVGLLFASPWFLLGVWGFSLMGFFVTEWWFYPVIKKGLRKMGIKNFFLYVPRSRALEMIVSDGAK